ncbi:MAG: hypothetical protein QY332_20835 [Anaerolineales bacterium]|nr:MAG: hypothetical protein QY332_20835 [Anaerolineales bacterium]
MSLEDILKVLVNSRQQESSPQSADPMTDLIGNLLANTQTQSQSHTPMAPSTYQPQQQQTGGLGSMMGFLEMVMGGNQAGVTSQPSMANNPIMMLLQPYVEKLAKKMNIPPQIAMMVVSYVAYKLLAHHPSSGRDSNSFNLDEMLNQMNSGKIDQSIFQNSGMVMEISKSTGLDEATATKTLNAAFGMFSKQMQTGKTPPTTTRKAPVRGSLKSTRVKRGAKGNR